MNTPDPQAQPMRVADTNLEPTDNKPIKVLLHSHAAGYTGVITALAGFLGPATVQLTNTSFMNDLMFGANQVRWDNLHQLATSLVIGAIIGTFGLGMANAGKGPFSEHADPNIIKP